MAEPQISWWDSVKSLNPLSDSPLWDSNPANTALNDNTWLDTFHNAFYKLPVIGRVMDQFTPEQKAKVAYDATFGSAPGLSAAANQANYNKTLADLSQYDAPGLDAILGNPGGSTSGIGALLIVGAVFGLVVYTFTGKAR